ncbi:MAG: hypothetical protein HY272_11285 [Gammaproteobacteria bacterium]|nr:hypothetical protein [Gammaproteobacteria bacterium]
MARKSVAELATGWVLSKDVIDMNGRILLRTGMALTDKAIRVMQIWGVTEVDIDIDAEPEESHAKSIEMTEAETKTVDERIAQLYAHCDRSQTLIAQLTEYSRLRILAEIRNEKAH